MKTIFESLIGYLLSKTEYKYYLKYIEALKHSRSLENERDRIKLEKDDLELVKNYHHNTTLDLTKKLSELNKKHTNLKENLAELEDRIKTQKLELQTLKQPKKQVVPTRVHSYMHNGKKELVYIKTH